MISVGMKISLHNWNPNQSGIVKQLDPNPTITQQDPNPLGWGMDLKKI